MQGLILSPVFKEKLKGSQPPLTSHFPLLDFPESHRTYTTPEPCMEVCLKQKENVRIVIASDIE